MTANETHPHLVHLIGGDRLVCDNETPDGVWTDAGIIPWSEVEGFWSWYAPINHYVFTPV